MRRRTRCFERWRNCARHWGRTPEEWERLERWEANHESFERRRVDCVSRWRGEGARGDECAPGRVSRVPGGTDTDRGGVYGTGCDAGAGPGNGLRTASVAAT